MIIKINLTDNGLLDIRMAYEHACGKIVIVSIIKYRIDNYLRI